MTRPRFYGALIWFAALAYLGLWAEARADVQVAREAEARAERAVEVRDSVLGPEPLRPGWRLLTDSIYCADTGLGGWACTTQVPGGKR